MHSEHDVDETLNLYGDMVLRICSCYLKSKADQEDAFEDVFIKYFKSKTVFENEEHKKAWLIKTTFSVCKDHLRKRFWRNKQTLKDEKGVNDQYVSAVLEAVLALPKKYKEVIYMHYYEGYSGIEIAGILGVKENTVYSLLKRGRDLLKERLGGEWNE